MCPDMREEPIRKARTANITLLHRRIAALLRKLSPDNFDASKSVTLLGNAETVQKLKDGASAAEIAASWQTGLSEFDKTRRKYFLYK